MARVRRVRGGIDGLNAALRGWPKDASKELRDEAQKIAETVASTARSRGASQGGVSGKVAPSLRAKRDRYPSLILGRKTPKWRKSKSGGQYSQAVAFGAEFGSVTFAHLPPWRGNGSDSGYFVWPTIRDMEDETREAYADALMNALLRNL